MTPELHGRMDLGRDDVAGGPTCVLLGAVLAKATAAVGAMSDSTTKAAATIGLDAIVKHKDDLTHLGGEGVTAIVTALALGSPTGALELLGGEDAEALIAASEASTNATLGQASMARKAVAVLSAIGADVWRAALPALVAAL